MMEIKFRLENSRLQPRRTKLEMPGWAGKPEPRTDGSQEQTPGMRCDVAEHVEILRAVVGNRYDVMSGPLCAGLWHIDFDRPRISPRMH